MDHPSYLRVVVNARCSLACAYCHQEGDPAGLTAGGLPTAALTDCLHAGLDNGARKLKLLGGEPLLRADLPPIVADLRARDPSLDISVITGGAVPVQRLDALFDAGLSRANLSIHGWMAEAFARRTRRGESARRLRDRVLASLIRRGRPTKLNYVYTGPGDRRDLAALLDEAASWPVVVNVLDDLSNPALDHRAILAVLQELRGAPTLAWEEPDPHSLPTRRLRWRDGLVVEVKDQQLGQHAPWGACGTCPVRARCREGIHALRLSHDGRLRPCMDRPDLGLDLRPLIPLGRAALAAAWRCFLAGAHKEAA